MDRNRTFTVVGNSRIHRIANGGLEILPLWRQRTVTKSAGPHERERKAPTHGGRIGDCQAQDCETPLEPRLGH